MRIKRTLATVAAAALATTGLVACSNDSDDTADNAAGNNGDNVTVKIGTTEADQEAWRVFKDLAADNGIDLDIVQFSDYSPVNEALAQGELDVNKFQHIKYLAAYNQSSGNDLRVVGSTEIVPLALFWKDHDSIDGIEGESVAIPNDPSNQGRAINVPVRLQRGQAGHHQQHLAGSRRHRAGPGHLPGRSGVQGGRAVHQRLRSPGR